MRNKYTIYYKRSSLGTPLGIWLLVDHSVFEWLGVHASCFDTLCESRAEDMFCYGLVCFGTFRYMVVGVPSEIEQEIPW